MNQNPDLLALAKQCELPPLPEGWTTTMTPDPDGPAYTWFDDQQRHEYALAAVSKFAAALQAAQPENDPNAPWLTQAHMLCSDHGIPQGLLHERLASLREKLDAAAQPDREAPASYTSSALVSDHANGAKVTFYFNDAQEADKWHESVIASMKGTQE